MSMGSVDTTDRVLAREEITDLQDARRRGWGEGFAAALDLGPVACIEHLEASGLRGRGGAGFPTGRKWRTVAEYSSSRLPSTVVVNAAEGEPGSFKDRLILRRDPYRVLEGALIAAVTLAADAVVIATKSSFATEIARLRAAIEEVAPEAHGISFDIVEGPGEYLFGEESGLLEVVAGRPPLPRIAPPYRAGVDEADPGRGAAGETLAAPGDATNTPPTLVNNVETLANVPGILASGPAWFRELGTDESPGSVVCTITGRTRRHGVAEVPMGTPLRSVIEEVGGGAEGGHEFTAAVSGVANPIIPAEQFDAALSYEAMSDAGTGLGAAGFIVFDDRTDPVALARGVARFLAVESCGQCTPCKLDGLAIAGMLARDDSSGDMDLAGVRERLARITDGARCNLALQHQQVVGSILDLFGRQFEGVELPATDTGTTEHSAEPIVPIVDIERGRARLDTRQLSKQPDWTFSERDSGQAPAQRLTMAPARTEG